MALLAPRRADCFAETNPPAPLPMAIKSYTFWKKKKKTYNHEL
jgi:hypothetical protein